MGNDTLTNIFTHALVFVRIRIDMEFYIKRNDNCILFPIVERGIPSSSRFFLWNKDIVETDPISTEKSTITPNRDIK